MEEQTTQVAEQPVVKGKNGLGLAGFIVALVGLVFCWIPVFGQILLSVGGTLALIGLILGIVKKKKLTLAIIGLVISCAGFIVAAILFTMLNSALTSL